MNCSVGYTYERLSLSYIEEIIAHRIKCVQYRYMCICNLINIHLKVLELNQSRQR